MTLSAENSDANYFKYNPIANPIPIPIVTKVSICNKFNCLVCVEKCSLILDSIALKFEFSAFSNAR